MKKEERCDYCDGYLGPRRPILDRIPSIETTFRVAAIIYFVLATILTLKLLWVTL